MQESDADLAVYDTVVVNGVAITLLKLSRKKAYLRFEAATLAVRGIPGVTPVVDGEVIKPTILSR